MHDARRIITALQIAWCPETATHAQGGLGHPKNQCAVTALLVQDLLGGDLLRCEFAPGFSHYWNLIPSVGEVDLTRHQYPPDYPIPRGIVVPRSRLLEGASAQRARTAERYALLRDRFEAALADYP